MNRNKFGIATEAPAVTEKVPKQYPWLSEEKHCDVCVVGGGMTGAMCALSAAEMGLSVVLITSDAIGYGDTGHITGCARFDVGRTLTELDRLMTVDDALRLYAMGFEALDGLQNLCGTLDGEFKNTGISNGFERRDLLLFTSEPTDLALLEREYIAVSKKFSHCTFITRKTAESAFAFPVAGGILTAEGSAVLNPYALAHLCLMKAESFGAEIFEQTGAVDIQTPHNEDGCVIIQTSTHRTVYADRLVLAAGSEGTRFLSGRVKKRTLYAVIAPLSENHSGWSGKCTLGTFGRHSENGSISSRGCLEVSCVCDSGMINRLFRSTDETVKLTGLTDFIMNVLPKHDDLKIKYKYAYTFISSPDGLPIIGKHPSFKNCIFALPGLYRGSELPIYSHIASKTASQLLADNAYEPHPLFDPMRLF